MPSESTGQQDIRANLRILWRWKLLFLAFLVVIPLAAYYMERGKPKIYQSSTLIEVTTSSLSTGSLNVPIVSNNLSAVAQLVTTTPVAQAAAAFLHPPASPGSLLGEITVTPNVDTGFLTIAAQDHSPQRAAAIANAFATALSDHQTAQENHNLNEQIGAVLAQIAVIPKNDQAGRAPFLQQVAALRAQRGATGAGAQVIEPAVASGTPVGPNTRRALELAGVIALLLGFGAVLAAESGDRRLRTPADLESLTGWPLLGVVPRGAFSPDRLSSPREEEAFQMLRGALTYFNAEGPIASVAITSPLMADGKTTVAVGLAMATALAGKRTILVDADLRHPQVCARLGLEPGAGLSDVLAGERQLADVLIEYPLDTPGSGSLLVLPAGPPPPNPAALISSQTMTTLIRQLETQADLVVIDTAAALAVSDSLALIRNASGVLMVVRMNRSSRAAVRRLQKVVVSAHGRVVGVVATGTGGASAGYGYYYAQNRRSKARRRIGFRRNRAPQRKAARPSAAAVVPVAPAAPVAPVAPVGPVAPVAAVAPVGPVAAVATVAAPPPEPQVVPASTAPSNGDDPSARDLAVEAARAAKRSLLKQLRKGQ